MTGIPTVVSDVMTRRVVALRTGAAFKDIVRAMREWRVSALPVLDDAGRVVGVVSEADLLRKQEYGGGGLDWYGRARDLTGFRKADAATAGELMTAPAVTVPPDAGLAQAARIMARGEVKRLPVVDHAGMLKGIVSRSDLLKVFLRDDQDIAEDVRREVVARLFGPYAEAVRVEVRDGVVTLAGRTPETALVPLATALARTVAGVVDVQCALSGPPRHPDLDPDLPDPQRSASA
ncbi:CBS domain-containing protein [Streptomyces olivaceoviridis]|uniref:CBS domain-containing protein n=1 Tax=Streptomyces olivaceoviridis TaxID=1921 RepID=UPI0033A4C9F4